MATLNQTRLEEQKKQRRKNMLTVTLIEMLFSIYLVSIMVQLLEGIADENFINEGLQGLKLNYSYLYAVNEMLIPKMDIHKMLFLLIQAAYFTYIVMITNPYEEKIEKTDSFYITPEIKKPKPAGNGQCGNARFLREDEKEELYEKFTWNGDLKDIQIEKGGIVVNYKKQGKTEIIYYIKKSVHTLIRAATGFGKTRRILLETIALQLLSGISIVNSDVKGEIYYYTSPFARQIGYETYPLDFRNPRKSIHYNFMQPIIDEIDRGDQAKAIDNTWDLVSALVGEAKGERIWHDGECATIAATLLILATEAPREYRNLTNAYAFLSYMCQPDEYGNTPLNQYMMTLQDNHPAKMVFSQATIAPHRTRSSFYTSALGTLRLFTNPSIAEMTSRSDFRLEDIATKKCALYMMIPDEKDTYYPLITLLITQMYSAFVSVANHNGGEVINPVDFNLDEVGNFPKIPVLGNIVSAGRSRGIRANLIIQDDQQMQKIYEKEYRNIQTNCKCKIFLGGDDTETLERICKPIGSYTAESNSASSSTSGKLTGTDSNVSISQSSQLTGVKLLEPSELQLFKEPYALCQVTGERSAVNQLPDLSSYYFNEMFGLGDEKHNQKIIMEREAEREERSIPEINLWGIWEQYRQPEETGAEVPEQTNISFLD